MLKPIVLLLVITLTACTSNPKCNPKYYSGSPPEKTKKKNITYIKSLNVPSSLFSKPENWPKSHDIQIVMDKMSPEVCNLNGATGVFVWKDKLIDKVDVYQITKITPQGI